MARTMMTATTATAIKTPGEKARIDGMGVVIDWVDDARVHRPNSSAKRRMSLCTPPHFIARTASSAVA